MKWIRIIVILSVFFNVTACAQQARPAFWKDIQDFKKKDSVSFPAAGQILLVGSSSFTKWTDVQNYFPGYPILNRGFGGSTLTDVIRYADDIILPYKPKQIIIYCGENDFASDEKLQPAEVAERFYTLFNIIRKKYKKVPVAFVSMKPSPSRTHLMPKYVVANGMIKAFLQKKKKTAFIDVYPAMLNSDGSPMQDIFVEDNLHMNAKGYAIWQKIIAPYLIR